MRRSTLNALREVVSALNSEAVYEASDDINNNTSTLPMVDDDREDDAVANRTRQQACIDGASNLRKIIEALRTAEALKALRNPPSSSSPTSSGGGESTKGLPIKRHVDEILRRLHSDKDSDEGTGICTHRPCSVVSTPLAIQNAMDTTGMFHMNADVLKKLQPAATASANSSSLVNVQVKQREQRAWCYSVGRGGDDSKQKASPSIADVGKVFGNLQLEVMSVMAKEHIELTTKLRLMRDLNEMDERIQQLLEDQYDNNNRAPSVIIVGQKRPREDETAGTKTPSRLWSQAINVLRCEGGLVVLQLQSLCVLYLTYNVVTKKWALLHLEWTALGVITRPSPPSPSGGVGGVSRVLVRLVPHQHPLVTQTVAKKFDESGLYSGIQCALLASCGFIMEHVYTSLRSQPPTPGVPLLNQNMLNTAEEQGFLAFKFISPEATEPLYTRLRLDFRFGGVSVERLLGANIKSMVAENWISSYLSKSASEVSELYKVGGGGGDLVEAKEVNARYAVVDIAELMKLASTPPTK